MFGVKQFKEKSIDGKNIEIEFKKPKNNFIIFDEGKVFFSIKVDGIAFDEYEIKKIMKEGIDFSQISPQKIKEFKRFFKYYISKYQRNNTFKIFWWWINKCCILSEELLVYIIKKITYNFDYFYEKDISDCFWEYFNKYQIYKICLSREFIEKNMYKLNLNALFHSPSKESFDKKLILTIVKLLKTRLEDENLKEKLKELTVKRELSEGELKEEYEEKYKEIISHIEKHDSLILNYMNLLE